MTHSKFGFWFIDSSKTSYRFGTGSQTLFVIVKNERITFDLYAMEDEMKMLFGRSVFFRLY